MLNKAMSQTLRRRQLDRALKPLIDAQPLVPPRDGWIHEIRNAIGMTAARLAGRMQITQPYVAKMEKAEANGSISLANLRRAAEAMDCTLVYAIVPRRSLEEFLIYQAEQAASRVISRTAHTMALEKQETQDQFTQEQIKDLAAELVRTMSREIWSEESDDKRAAL
jgi:predicted DNA-binding mobile mystery protein A